MTAYPDNPEMQEHAQRVADSLPRPTPAQLNQIAMLLGPAVADAAKARKARSSRTVREDRAA